MNEPAHLLLVTLGPVQEFIAQARRTRDLWFGSHLLSELSRAVARRLLSERWDDERQIQPVQGTLIFPWLSAGAEELLPCDELLRPSGQPPLAIANKILALLPAGVDPRWAAKEARAAAQQRWTRLAQRVKERCRDLIAAEASDAFDAQIRTFLEFQAAWVACSQSDLDDDARYREKRQELEGALGGRKLLRDFAPYESQRGAVPKSSLDGGRETVLRAPQERSAKLVESYRIASGEQLDAVGLVKRAGGAPGQFVPIVNVALAGWTERAERTVAEPLERLRKACNELGISAVDRQELPWVCAFPFDAQVFLQSRWRAIFQELRGAEPKDQPAVQRAHDEANRWGRAFVRPLFGAAGMSEPLPYVACLVADGDRVGRALDQMSFEQHQIFSRALSGFPQRARRIVEGRCRGVLVYAGGDDVLAFLCLEDALRCADELRLAFAEVMADALPAGAGQVSPPTLSVGIGVGHALDSMGHLRNLGRRAEERAKARPERNRLVVLLDKRSGGELWWESSWRSEPAPVAQLLKDMVTLEQRLPTKKIYEVITAVQQTPSPEILMNAERPGWAALLKDDVTRALRRADAGDSLTPAEAGLDLPDEDYAERRQRVLAWGDRLLVARFFAQARGVTALLPGVS